MRRPEGRGPTAGKTEPISFSLAAEKTLQLHWVTWENSKTWYPRVLVSHLVEYYMAKSMWTVKYNTYIMVVHILLSRDCIKNITNNVEAKDWLLKFNLYVMTPVSNSFALSPSNLFGSFPSFSFSLFRSLRSVPLTLCLLCLSSVTVSHHFTALSLIPRRDCSF